MSFKSSRYDGYGEVDGRARLYGLQFSRFRGLQAIHLRTASLFDVGFTCYAYGCGFARGGYVLLKSARRGEIRML